MNSDFSTSIRRYFYLKQSIEKCKVWSRKLSTIYNDLPMIGKVKIYVQPIVVHMFRYKTWGTKVGFTARGRRQGISMKNLELTQEKSIKDSPKNYKRKMLNLVL